MHRLVNVTKCVHQSVYSRFDSRLILGGNFLFPTKVRKRFQYMSHFVKWIMSRVIILGRKSITHCVAKGCQFFECIL